MAIVGSNLTFGAVDSAVSSTTTASISPGANNLVLVTVINNRTANSPAISGNGMTWVQVAQVTVGGTEGILTMFRGMSASPSAGVITITITGTNSIFWAVDQFSGVDTGGANGANALVQSGTDQRVNSVSNETITLSALRGASNVGYGVINNRTNVASVTTGSGFTELSNATLLNGVGGQTSLQESEYKVNQNAVSWTFAPSGNTTMLAIAVEIAAPAGGGFFQFL